MNSSSSAQFVDQFIAKIRYATLDVGRFGQRALRNGLIFALFVECFSEKK